MSMRGNTRNLWFAVLVGLSLSSVTLGKRINVKGRTAADRRRELQDLPVKVELFHREDTNGFPGATFYEDGEGKDEFATYAWEKTHRMHSTDGDWQWRHKTSSYDDDADCKSSKSSKSDKTSSPTITASPTMTNSPTAEPTMTFQPSISSAPTGSKKSKKSAMPTLTYVPTPEPSLSFQPSTTFSPTRSSKSGKGDSGKAGSGKAGSGKAGKSNRCTDVPTLVPSRTPSAFPSRSPSFTGATGSSDEPAPSKDTNGSGSDPTDGNTSGGGDGDGDGDGDGNGDGDGDDSDSLDSLSPQDEVCTAIADGTAPNDDTNKVEYEVSINVLYDSTTSSAVIANELSKLDTVIALYVAGCEESARVLYKEITSSSTRKLASRDLRENTYEYVQYEGSWDAGSDNDGDVTLSNELGVWSQEEDADVIARIEEAISEFVGTFLTEEVGGVTSVTGSVENPNSNGSTNAATEDDNAVVPAGGVNAGTAVGIAAAGLALLLLLILLAKRNNDDDEVSHLKLEDDNDETFIREFGSDSNGSFERNAHIVGEADSIFSGWTGYNSRGGSGSNGEVEIPIGKLAHPKGDVHICSSATCEVCERKRQQGVQFVATGTPPRPQGLPSDVTREYVADDTVEL